MTTQDGDFLNYIDGAWAPAATGSTFINTDPADTSQETGRFQASAAEDGRRAVDAAARAFDSWCKTPPGKRAKILNGAADYLETNADTFARDMTREMGKALNLSRDEIPALGARHCASMPSRASPFPAKPIPHDDPDMAGLQPARAAGRRDA